MASQLTFWALVDICSCTPLIVLLDYFEGLQLSHTSKTVIGVLLNKLAVPITFLLLF